MRAAQPTGVSFRAVERPIVGLIIVALSGRVPRSYTALVDESRPVSTFDEIAPLVNERKQALKGRRQWIVAVRKLETRICVKQSTSVSKKFKSIIIIVFFF